MNEPVSVEIDPSDVPQPGDSPAESPAPEVVGQPEAGQAEAQQPILPEGYGSVEEALADLARLKAGGTPPPAEGQEGEPKPAEAPGGDQAAVAALQARTAQEVSELGGLRPETYLEWERRGFAKDAVDMFVSGQQALAAQADQVIFEPIGGPEGWQELNEWATQNLSAEEIESVNTALAEGSPQMARFAVQALASRRAEASGEPARVIEGSAAPSSGEVFSSEAEWMEAMRDPRWVRDPSWRHEQELKFDRSMKAGRL